MENSFNPKPEDQNNGEKKVYKAAVVDLSKLAEAQARDVADSRMTEDKEDRAKGFKNWLVKTGKRIWKHNIAQEWYRQREIGRVKEEISESGNLYAGETKDTTMKDYEDAKKAVVERFTSEYEDEMLKTKEKDSKENVSDQKTKDAIKDLMIQFAGDTTMSEAAFIEEQNRILSTSNPEYAEKGKMYASNLLDIAREIRNSFSHGEKLAAMDFDVEITLGQAEESLNTEAKHNSFEKIIEKTQNSKLGKYLFNEPAGVAIAAGLYSAVNFLGMKVLRSKAAKIGSFGAAAFLAGGISASKEAARLNRERAQHIRESAKGMEFKESDMKRRKEMEENRYETRNASDIIQNFEKDLAKVSNGRVTESELDAVLVTLSDLEARIALADKEKVDLIAYSRFNKVEEERMKLDQYRAKIKVMIRKGIGEGRIEFTKGGTIDEHLKNLVGAQTNESLSKDIEEKNRIFKEMKTKKVAKAFVKTALIGASVGFLFQEGHALLDSKTDGVFEGVFKHEEHLTTKATALEGLRRWISGDNPRLPYGVGHEELLGNTHIQLPDGVTMHYNTDETVDILSHGKVISDHVKLLLDERGNLDDESIKALAKDGIHTSFAQVGDKVTEHVTRNASEYTNEHPELTTRIHRSWMDNDTPMHPDPAHPGHLLGADLNELRTQWGGVGGTGIDEHGNYVFNVQHMTDDGSFHDGLSVAAQEQMKKGGLTLLLSVTKGLQHTVFKVPIDIHGNAIVDPHSPIGEMMFQNNNGHALFTGQFAEIGHSTGLAQDGGENMQILGTHIGSGRSGTVVEDIIKDTVKTHVKLDVPADWDWNMPPVIPIGARRPLEKGEYGEMGIPPPVYYRGISLEEIQKEFKENSVEEDPYTLKTLENGNKVWVNKEGKEVIRSVEREKARISSYLGKQQEKYLSELKDYNKNLEPMNENCRISVIIPARFEEKNLKNLLDQYVKQVDEKGNPINKDLFEINIIINRKEGEKADKSTEIITEWKKANPGYHVNAIDATFPKEKANVGMARKYITDLSLMRSIERKKYNGPLYIESEDADLFSVDKRTINKLINGFDKKPYLDVLRGIQDRQPEIMSKNDLLFFERRLWDIGETTARDLSLRPDKFNKSSFTWNRIISGGWNTAYTAEAYVQIGGYVSDVIAEDMKIGQKISVLRGKKDIKDNKFVINTYTAEVSGLRANSSPRRFIDAMVKQESPYDNFEDQSLKGKTIEELMTGLKRFERISPEHRQRYESGINAIYKFMKDEMGPGEEAKKSIEKTLFYMGLKQGENLDYIFNIKNIIEITNKGYEKIGQLLVDYRNKEKWKLGYRRQNSPLIIEKDKSNDSKNEDLEESIKKSPDMVVELPKKVGEDGEVVAPFKFIEDKIIKFSAKMKKLREDLKKAEKAGNEEEVLRVEAEIKKREEEEKEKVLTPEVKVSVEENKKEKVEIKKGFEVEDLSRIGTEFEDSNFKFKIIGFGSLFGFNEKVKVEYTDKKTGSKDKDVWIKKDLIKSFEEGKVKITKVESEKPIENTKKEEEEKKEKKIPLASPDDGSTTDKDEIIKKKKGKSKQENTKIPASGVKNSETPDTKKTDQDAESNENLSPAEKEKREFENFLKVGAIIEEKSVGGINKQYEITKTTGGLLGRDPNWIGVKITNIDGREGVFTQDISKKELFEKYQWDKSTRGFFENKDK